MAKSNFNGRTGECSDIGLEPIINSR